MSTPYVLPAQASPTGNYRGVCDWADRPLTFNSVGDTLRIADRAMVEYVWNGTAWVSNFAAPGAIGGTTPAAGAFTTLSASGVITSTVPLGTAPLAVLSTTQVANLNVSMLGGMTFAAPGAIGGTTPAAGAFTTLSASGVASFADGSAAAPSVSFTNDPDTGLISSAANALGLVTGGVERWMVNASGALNPIADNTYDIGGATKPRDIEVGRRVTSPNVAITAAAPASASATGTVGEIRSDAEYIYVCTATDTWKRAAIATWA